MKWNKEENYISFKNESVFIFYWCDWVQWNWKNVTMIGLKFEDDIMTGGREIEIGLLGFNLRIRWTHETPEGDEFKKETDDAFDILLNKSFYGWASENKLKLFKDKVIDHLTVCRTRKTARETVLYDNDKKLKKLFIQ